jgi:hypothetical protein
MAVRRMGGFGARTIGYLKVARTIAELFRCAGDRGACRPTARLPRRIVLLILSGQSRRLSR